ncbi:26092_t:CDS:2 [Dentiscutata erythropus]|uniref:26092_t:CDS:1 n=1 Tax=Dentiscutata erythropus TaxID=1348616 RepID=A0A9N9HBC8_9GLOM|nr:26092_t:CDS:2 [Dentiscutata erythropus]
MNVKSNKNEVKEDLKKIEVLEHLNVQNKFTQHDQKQFLISFQSQSENRRNHFTRNKQNQVKYIKKDKLLNKIICQNKSEDRKKRIAILEWERLITKLNLIDQLLVEKWNEYSTNIDSIENLTMHSCTTLYEDSWGEPPKKVLDWNKKVNSNVYCVCGICWSPNCWYKTEEEKNKENEFKTGWPLIPSCKLCSDQYRRIYHMGRQCPREEFKRWSKGEENNFYNELSLEE